MTEQLESVEALRARVAALEQQLDAERSAAVEREAELRLNEARFRAICEHAPVLIDSFDADGRLVLWNRECVRTLGYTFEEVAATENAMALFYPDETDAARVRASVGRADGRFREYSVRAKDGTTRIQLWADLQLPNGTHISVGHDITERRAIEERMRQGQKMEALGRLSGGIAHDFNNLLTVVLAYADLLGRKVGQIPGTDSMVPQVNRIRRAADGGAALVRKLMAFGRREMLRRQRVDLGRLVEDLVPTLRRLLPDTIRVEVEHGPLDPVDADLGALEQIVLNLANNARDAMPAGGTLTLRTRRAGAAELRSSPDESGEVAAPYGVLEVSDDGVGMDDETRSRALEPFFTTKSAGEGTGLGLAMVYGLVHQHGGHLELSSAVGRGTTISLYLPLAVGAEDPLSADDLEEITTAPASGASVLVVEDDEAIREATVATLEDAGYHVRGAVDGQQALDAITQDGAPDVIVCDVVMPMLDGIGLQRELRRLQIQVPILFVTGYPRGAEPLAYPLDPDVPLLQKPWTADRLLAMLRELLEGAR